jgi:hypothetical protein
LVYGTLGLLGFARKWIGTWVKRSPQLTRLLQNLSKHYPENIESLAFLQTLIDELVIVIWVLLIIFWVARHQGMIDARRDAVNETSTLPVISLITNQKNLILGSDLSIIEGSIPPDPTLANNVIIGDVNLPQIIRAQGLNNPAEQRVWRLLTERGGWIFIFPTLSAQSSPQSRPPVLAVPKAVDEQILILSPDVPTPTP